MKHSSLHNIFRKTMLLLLAVVMATSNSVPVGAVLVDKALVEEGITQYDSRVSMEACGTDAGTGDYGDVDRFLQVLADQESGGNPTATNSLSSASGKYQYIDGTWRARYTIYPPASQYARAKDAPEAVQDAVAYIEYSQKFVDFEGDIFKLAISHFYPAANTNPALLDTHPGGNSITPREYAESVMKKITEGVGLNIPLLYRQAPEFDTYNKFSPATDSPAPTTGQPSPTPAPTPAPGAAEKPSIFLDPGHGGAVAEYTDRVTGLRDRETANAPESSDVLDVARRVKAALETDGYTVTMSRTNNTAGVNKRARVEAAQAAKADIAVSIHTTPGSLNEVWSQKLDTYREYGTKKVTFTNAETAKLSQKYAVAFAETRGASEGREVGLDANHAHQRESFSRDGVPSKGDISLLQLWAQDIPWVYNEFALGSDDRLNEADKQKYSTGIIEGIRKALGGTAGDAGAGEGECVSAGAGFGGGDLSQTVLAYAWPEYHSGPYLRMQPAWKAVVQKAPADGIYVGGIAHKGIDCGGFVTNLIVNSGFDPGYNHGGKISEGAGYTVIQKAWADANWQKLGSGSSIDTGSLQPGDVAFSPGHTFVFVGKIPNFKSNIASASLDSRAPMAGSESITSGSVTWYRKK